MPAFYIPGMSHHLLTPAEFDSICPFNLDTETCFERYTMKLLEKTETKRSPMALRAMRSLWNCPPGEDSHQCLDRYVSNIKLLKKKGVKRDAIQCGPGQERMHCFDKYIGSVHLLKSRSQLCPPGEAKVSCFDRYIDSMKLKPSHGKRSGRGDCVVGERELHCLSRYIKAIKAHDHQYLLGQGVQCEPGQDDIGCFDQYVEQLHFKEDPQEQKSKRQSVHCAPGEDDIVCLDHHVSSLKLARREEAKRAKGFRCIMSEDDLSCLDRYVKEVKLLPSVNKRSLGDFGCAPGDDSLACFDKYIKDIKVRDGFEKRSVECGPGEDDLACLDRHIQRLRLRAGYSKRSVVPFTGCLVEDDGLACLDRYIQYLKLAARGSQKRDCDPATGGFGCFDRYISDIKLRASKRSPITDPFCPPGEDGIACFDRYVKNIRLRYLPSKRLADCSPGDTSMECFDQYVNELKLKHPDMIKRSPILCPPGEDSWECFDRYIADIKLKGERSAMSANRIPRPQRRSSSIGSPPLSLRSAWPLCPPTINRVQCFDRYLLLMLQSMKSPARGDDSPMTDDDALLEVPEPVEEEPEVDEAYNKRAGSYCPSAMDNLECFHTYLSHWVISTSTPPKRTFHFGPGKREQRRRRAMAELPSCSRDPQSQSCLAELMAAFMAVADIRSKPQLEEAVSVLCEGTKDARDCEDQLRAAAYASTKPLPAAPSQQPKEEREARSICPAGVDQVRCFESLLHAYMHKVVPKGSTEFVGKRHAALS